MVSMASDLFDCEVVAADTRRPSNTKKILSVLRQRTQNGAGDEICLLVCTGPSDLSAVLNIENWRKRFRYLAAWIIDSFWFEHIPKSIRLRNPFDHIFVTSLEDVDRWRAITGVSCTWLPWGTDALGLGRGGGLRDWDLMRVGRQPPEWEDDTAAASAAELLGIRYRGRPESSGLNALQNQTMMMKAYGASKFTLAFSNAVNCDPNNHPTREYLTGRWVDALACGSTVAGVAPKGANSDALLWAGATLELGGVRRSAGLQVVATALRHWTPRIAEMNHQMALRQLDWRWRFKSLADVCGLHPARLTRDLLLLEARISEVTAAQILT